MSDFNPTHVAKPVEVQAYRITKVFMRTENHGTRRSFSCQVEDGTWKELTSDEAGRHMPRIDDYVIEQKDESLKISPKDSFERKYQPIFKDEPK